MDALIYFIIASFIATTGISFVVRNALKNIAVKPDESASIQSKMFIGVAVVEALPILFIILGYNGIESSTMNSTIPAILILIVAAINAFLIRRQSKELLINHSTKEEAKPLISALEKISYALVTAIPIVGIVACLIK
ncbi:hypothetical protein [Gottfriedia solisilvae]|uniref:V-ATPase proteolipid subunit C-like domain-containing protein n=1 Tax=Gottfriedia solisilvae TaxID=1516104 RepID=A0A8J3AWJ9_9BACI|nr:hypothetical protein [Gottfriedia solisilvae]GGI17553.1 hypothetical protein GCM10007380_38520 [Gottfriedia solisilvae]